MKVFMLGWEFPPHISGGLGTACHGLTRGLDDIGVEITFVLPTAVPVDETQHVRLRSPSNLPAREEVERHLDDEPGEFRHVRLHQVPASLQPYGTPAPPSAVVGIEDILEESPPTPVVAPPDVPAPPDTQEAVEVSAAEAKSFVQGAGANYNGDLMGQINRYARLAVELARRESFDVVHAHDWMTYPAGQAVAAASGKPLIIHVHSTEFDRAGENVNQQVYDIERTGMHTADRVVCVSYLTRRIVVSRYAVPEDKVDVVYNAVELPTSPQPALEPIQRDDKIVLFLGRVTMQKGPEYFLRAAKKVVEKLQNVRFVMAGSGDMIRQCIQEAAELKLGKYVTFTGFLRGGDVDKVFQMADLYVMPSVSEPFGIAPLEALSHSVPVIISKQSGVSEVLTHALKVDFWDIDEMANKILAVLRHPSLGKTLRQHGQIELKKLSWRDSAEQLVKTYDKAIAARRRG